MSGSHAARAEYRRTPGTKPGGRSDNSDWVRAVNTEAHSVPVTAAMASPDQARGAGLGLAVSRMVARILAGTGSKQNGSIEYEARPLDRERIAVA